MTAPSEKLCEIAADILQIEPGSAQQLRRASCGTRDSLNHLRIIMTVEEMFGVRLEPDEIASVSSLADLQGMIDGKSAAA